MAVKVVYDATRGLVQENDITGVGGFEIKDAFISQGSEDVNADADPALALLSPKGVSVVTVIGAADAVRLQNGTVVGQQKIIISAAASDADLEIQNAAGGVLVADGAGFDAGDVALLMWNGTAWQVIASS